ncbi:hypothetical protein Trydic_g4700 [Trypoxylus dichotomus]
MKLDQLSHFRYRFIICPTHQCKSNPLYVQTYLRISALQGLHGAMAKQTPGSKCDTGSKYELSVTALFVSSLSKNENVENYRIFTNVGEAHPFDDIVAEIHFKNSEQKQLYAIQVKSGKDKSAMNKYFEGYDKIMGKGGLKLGESVRNERIDFWYFCSKSPTRNTMIKDGETIDLKTRTRSTPYNVHEAILGKAVSYELYSNDPKTIDYQSFFNTFYLFLNQPDTPTIIHRLKGMWKINDPRQIISYLDNYFAKNGNILDKAAFEHELLKIRLSDYIVTPTKAIAFKHKAVNEWNQVTLDTDVTVVGNEVNVEQYLFGCILQNISDVISVDTWNDIINNEGKLNTDIKKQLRTTPFVMETLKDLVVQKWVDNKLPLILKTDALLPVLKEFSHLKKKYIIIDSNIVNRSVEIESYELRVFRHLGYAAADDMMKSIPVSLQGRKPTSLYEIIKEDGRLSESVTCTDIIRLMIPRQLYLKQECLGGNNYMFFIIETINAQEDDCKEHRPAGGNIVKYCAPGDSYEHCESIRANPRFINYKIFCLSLKDDNKLTLIPKTRDNVQYKEEYRGLEYFFVDQNGESVYNMENGDIIPIIGEVPIHVCWRYIPRCLRQGFEINEEKSSSEGVSNKFRMKYDGKLFGEKDFFNESNSKLVIITGAPGIGKTTLLHSLFRFCESKYYVLFVDLGRCQPDLRAGKLKSFEDLLRSTRNKCHPLSYKCFLKSLHDYSNRLVLILDSFDETVATSKQQILELIRNLQAVDFHNIIIASRLAATNLLLSTFKTKTFKLQDLKEQSDKHYTSNWNLDFNDLRHIPSEFTANPLYLNMLSTISENGVNLNILNKWSLYETVVNIKLEDYCLRRDLDEDEKQSILIKYEKLALKVVFGTNAVTQNLKVSLQSNFIRLGFITRCDNENPIFIHQTFAEFFIVKWLIRNVGHEDAAYIYKLLLDNCQEDILNIHLETFPVHKAILDKNTEELKRLSKQSISCLLEVDNLGRSVLHTTVIHVFSPRILKFLIQRMRKEGYNMHVCDKIIKWTWIDYFEKFQRNHCLYRLFTFKEAYWNYYATYVEKLQGCIHSLSVRFYNLYDDAICHSSISLLRDLLYLKYRQDETFMEFREMCLQSQNSVRMRRELLDIHLSDEKLTGIHLACIYSNTEAVRVYTEAGKNFSEIDKFNCTPLHYSVMTGQSNEILNLLLENCKISIHYVGITDSTTIFHMSVRTRNVNVTRVVLEQVNIDLCPKDYYLQLWLASIERNEKHSLTRLDVIATLVSEEDKRGHTPLGLAIKQENKDMIEILLKYCRSLNFLGVKRAPLPMAIERRNRDIVELLLQHGADPNYIDAWGTPLNLAIRSNDKEIVQILLRCHADVNLQDGLDGSPLICACNSRTAILELLLKHGADVNELGRFKDTPLTYAIKLNLKNTKDVVQMLLDYKADINLKDNDDKTPLGTAINTENLQVIELLLRNGARTDCMDLNGRTPLIYAVRMGKKRVVQVLLDHGADANLEGISGTTALSTAIIMNLADIIPILLNNQSDINCINEYGGSPLMITVEMGNTQIAKMLLERDADVNFKSKYGITALYVAAFKENLAMVELLLSHGADVTINTSGEEILHKAKTAGNIEIVVRLLKGRGHSSGTVNASKESNSAMNIIETVARNWAGINLKEELRTAIGKGLVNLKTIKNLMEWGGDIDIEDEFWVAVFYLINEMNSEMVDDLFYCGTPHLVIFQVIYQICSDPNENRNLDIIKILARRHEIRIRFFMKAVTLNNKEVIRSVLQNTDDVTGVDGYSPLGIAVHAQNIDVIEMLLERKCAVNDLNEIGLTPLIIAVATGNIEIVRILLENGADVNFKVRGCGLTSLYVAAMTENRSIVGMLLEWGANINVETSKHLLQPLVDRIDDQIILPSIDMDNVREIIEEESTRLFIRIEREYVVS